MTCLRPCTSSISKIKFYSHKPHKSQFKSLILSSNMSTLGLFPCQMVRNLFFLYCSVYFFRLVNYPLKSRWHKFYRTQNRIFQSVKHSPVIDLVQNPSREIWLRFSWLRFRAYICLYWVQSKLNEKKKASKCNITFPNPILQICCMSEFYFLWDTDVENRKWVSL